MNNNFIIVGRITKDLELKSTSNGKSILKVNIAVQNGKDDTTFIETTIFGKMAETTSQYCRKGDLIGVSGIIKNHNWEDKNGSKHYDYTFLANKVTFLQTKNERTKAESTKESNEDIFADFGEQIQIDLDDDNLLD